MANHELDPRSREITLALLEAQRQYERADDIENPLERVLKQDRLLEKLGELQVELETVLSPHPNKLADN